MRDIRAAIKPHTNPPQAKLHLPPQFAKPSPKVEGVAVQIEESVGATGDEAARNDASVERAELVEQEQALSQKRLKVVDPRLYDLPPEEKTVPVERENTGTETKPLSRAERRNKIKAEIMAGSEEEGFKGYRRRMW